MIVSLVALSVSLSGTAVAAKMLTGADIKNGSITAADIKRGSIGLAQLAPSALPRTGSQGPAGAVGAQGAPGAQGAAGARGGFDPSKIIHVTGADTPILPDDLTTLVAVCPAGGTVIGGGYMTTMGVAWSDQGVAWRDRWVVSVDNLGAFVTGTGRAVAVCAMP